MRNKKWKYEREAALGLSFVFALGIAGVLALGKHYIIDNIPETKISHYSRRHQRKDTPLPAYFQYNGKMYQITSSNNVPVLSEMNSANTLETKVENK